jgi:hypothetical protein
MAPFVPQAMALLNFKNLIIHSFLKHHHLSDNGLVCKMLTIIVGQSPSGVSSVISL